MSSAYSTSAARTDIPASVVEVGSLGRFVSQTIEFDVDSTLAAEKQEKGMFFKQSLRTDIRLIL